MNIGINNFSAVLMKLTVALLENCPVLDLNEECRPCEDYRLYPTFELPKQKRLTPAHFAVAM